MITILSPAKTFQALEGEQVLDMEKLLFPSQMSRLLEVLEMHSMEELGTLMKVSEKISELNYKRYQDFPGNTEIAGEAIHYFYGEAYKGLEAATLSGEALAFAKEHLLILSGLYGMIGPLDQIKPYRLEMGTRLVTEAGNNLYAYWKETLTQRMLALLEATDGDQVLVNLASDEYSKVLDLSQLRVNSKVLRVTFKVKKEGVYKINSMQAKKARGLMTRYILTHQINTMEGLKAFCEEGYRWDESMSTCEEWVFWTEIIPTIKN